MGIRLNGPKAADRHTRLNWKQPNGKNIAIEFENGVPIYTEDKQFPLPDATLTLDKDGFAGMLMGGGTLDKELASGHPKMEGNADKVRELFALLDTFNPMLPIVTP
jgi:alkyl sulfatase BDS1-like metallo-beta-lactamase superfamily hydrolase